MQNEEQLEHINVVSWFHSQYPELADDLHHFANERKCTPWQGKVLQRMGVKKGVPDLFLAFPWGGRCGMWLELKVGKNKPTYEQRCFLERKAMNGYACGVAWGFYDAEKMIRMYLEGYKRA